MEDESVVHDNNDSDVRENNDVDDDVRNRSVKIECDFIPICQMEFTYVDDVISNDDEVMWTPAI